MRRSLRLGRLIRQPRLSSSRCVPAATCPRPSGGPGQCARRMDGHRASRKPRAQGTAGPCAGAAPRGVDGWHPRAGRLGHRRGPPHCRPGLQIGRQRRVRSRQPGSVTSVLAGTQAHISTGMARLLLSAAPSAVVANAASPADVTAAASIASRGARATAAHVAWRRRRGPGEGARGGHHGAPLPCGAACRHSRSCPLGRVTWGQDGGQRSCAAGCRGCRAAATSDRAGPCQTLAGRSCSWPSPPRRRPGRPERR